MVWVLYRSYYISTKPSTSVNSCDIMQASKHGITGLHRDKKNTYF